MGKLHNSIEIMINKSDAVVHTVKKKMYCDKDRIVNEKEENELIKKIKCVRNQYVLESQ